MTPEELCREYAVDLEHARGLLRRWLAGGSDEPLRQETIAALHEASS